MAGYAASLSYPLLRGDKTGRLYVLTGEGENRQIVCPCGEKRGAMHYTVRPFLRIPTVSSR